MGVSEHCNQEALYRSHHANLHPLLPHFVLKEGAHRHRGPQLGESWNLECMQNSLLIIGYNYVVLAAIDLDGAKHQKDIHHIWR